MFGFLFCFYCICVHLPSCRTRHSAESPGICLELPLCSSALLSWCLLQVSRRRPGVLPFGCAALTSPSPPPGCRYRSPVPVCVLAGLPLEMLELHRGVGARTCFKGNEGASARAHCIAFLLTTAHLLIYRRRTDTPSKSTCACCLGPCVGVCLVGRWVRVGGWGGGACSASPGFAPFDGSFETL